jgi:hypothetical protein
LHHEKLFTALAVLRGKKERRSVGAESARGEIYCGSRRRWSLAVVWKSKRPAASDAPLSVFSGILSAHGKFIEEFTTFVKAYFSIRIIGLLLSFSYIFGPDNL